MAATQSICEEFSKGNFSAVFSHFHQEIQWELIGNDAIKGKDAVIEFCNKMSVEMAGSQLTNLHITTGNDSVAIEGICNYTSTEGKQAKVQYCDVYRFDQDRIISIASYCINS